MTLDDLDLNRIIDNMVCYVADIFPHEELCRVCCKVTGAESILCDWCNGTYHKSCLATNPEPVGFWYCPACQQKVDRRIIDDITTDMPLMQHILGVPQSRPLSVVE